MTDSGETTARAKTQAAAEKRAKADVKDAGGGQVYIRRPDGRIQDADTVAPGNESKKRDAKH